MQVPTLFEQQRSTFASGKLSTVNARREALDKLAAAVTRFEKPILDALNKDLGRHDFESMLTEVAFIREEIRFVHKRLHKWMKPQTVSTPLTAMPGTSKIYSIPHGVTLIIAPWNFPFQLAIAPLIGSIAAGNTAIIKPSELTPHTAQVIQECIESAFSADEIAVVQGEASVTTELLDAKPDFVFFTGSPRVGSIIAQACAKHLIPNVLELGGKSPAVLDETYDQETAVRRVIWGKLVNAGQVCVSPDYLLVPNGSAQRVTQKIKDQVHAFYGDQPSHSEDYSRIVSERHYQRLKDLRTGHDTTYQMGEDNDEACKLAPSVVINPKLESELMREEIFGPILPVIEYSSIDEAQKIIERSPNPLAAYLFSHDRELKQKFTQRWAFGGGCIGDTVMHLANPNLPFGGRGTSGLGAYHGKASFDVFSHQKSVMEKPGWPDIPLRYPPYKDKLNLLKMILKL